MCKMFSWLALHVVCTCTVQHTCTSPLSPLTQVILITLAFIHEPLNLGCRSRDFPQVWGKNTQTKVSAIFQKSFVPFSFPLGVGRRKFNKLISLFNELCYQLRFFLLHSLHNVYIRHCFMALVTLKFVSKLLLNLILPGIPGMYHVIQILKINVNKF